MIVKTLHKSKNANKKKHNGFKKIPLIYIYVYYKLREATKKVHTYPYLSTADLLNIVRRIMRTPKKMNYPLLHEMEECGLICKINHQRFWISDKKICSKFVNKIKDYIEYEFW